MNPFLLITGGKNTAMFIKLFHNERWQKKLRAQMDLHNPCSSYIQAKTVTQNIITNLCQ